MSEAARDRVYSFPAADPEAPKAVPFEPPGAYLDGRQHEERPLAVPPPLELSLQRGYVLVMARPKGRTAGGIYVPASSRRTPRLAGYVVLAVGPPRMTSQGVPVESVWRVGQMVAVFPGHAATWRTQRDVVVCGAAVPRGTELAAIEDAGIFCAVSGDEDSLVSDIVGPDQCVE